MYRKIREEHKSWEERTATVDEPGALTVQRHRKGLSRRGMKDGGRIIAACRRESISVGGRT